MTTEPTTALCGCAITVDPHGDVHAHPCHPDHLDPLLRRAVTTAGNHQLHVNLHGMAYA